MADSFNTSDLQQLLEERKRSREEQQVARGNLGNLIDLRKIRRDLGNPLRPEELEDPGFWGSFWGPDADWSMGSMEDVAKAAPFLGPFATNMLLPEPIRKKIPFLGAAEEMIEDISMWWTASRVDDGTGTEEDERALLEWVGKRQLESLREHGQAADVGAIIGESVPFVGEFILSAGLFAGTKKAVSKIVQKKLRSAIGKATSKQARKRAAIVAGTLPAVGVQATVASSPRIVGGAAKLMMPELGLTEDEQGELGVVIAGEGTPLGQALVRSWADQVIEYGSERTGWMLGKMFTKPMDMVFGKGKADAALKATIAKLWLGLDKTRPVQGLRKAVDKAGWHGIAGEMFEERVGAALRMPIEHMTGDEIIWELGKVAERIGFTQDQLLTEFYAFGLFQNAIAAGVGSVGAVEKIRDLREESKLGKEILGAVALGEETAKAREEVKDVLGDTVEEGDVTQPGKRVVVRDKNGNVIYEVPVSDEAQASQVLEALGELSSEREYETSIEEQPATILILNEKGEVEEAIDATQEEYDQELEKAQERAAKKEGWTVETLNELAQQLAAEAERDKVEEEPVEVDETATLQKIEAEEKERTGSETVKVEVVPDAERSSIVRRVQASLSGRGIKVVPIRSTEGELQTPGAYFNGTVYIADVGNLKGAAKRKATRDMFMGVLTHELVHNMEKENPELYRWLVSRAPRLLGRGALKYMSATGGLDLKGMLSEGGAQMMQDLIMKIGGGKILSRIDTERTMVERFLDWLRYHATRLGLRGQALKDIQELVEEYVSGKAVADIKVEGKRAKQLAKAKERGVVPESDVAPLTSQEESDVQFAFNNPFAFEQRERARARDVYTGTRDVYTFHTEDGREFDVFYEYDRFTPPATGQALNRATVRFEEAVTPTGLKGIGTGISGSNRETARIFATVLETTNKMLKEVDPDTVAFVAVEDIAGSREKLYDALVRRYAGGAGYEVIKQTTTGAAGYKLVKPEVDTRHIRGERLDVTPKERPQFAARQEIPDEATIQQYQKLLNIVKTNPDGFTVDLKGNFPDGGYVVAPSKATERVVSSDTLDIYALHEYIMDNAELFELEGSHLGGWFNSENNEYVLDVSFPLPSYEDAVRTAIWADQDAIFDLNTFNEIRTKDEQGQPKTPEGFPETAEELIQRRPDDIPTFAMESYTGVTRGVRVEGGRPDYGRIPEEPRFAARPKEEVKDPRGLGRAAAVALRILSPDELERAQEPQFAAAPEKGSAEEARIFKGAYKGGVGVSHGTVAEQIFWDFSIDYELGAHFGTPLAAEERLGYLTNEPDYDIKNDKYLRVYDVRLNIKKPFKMNDVGVWTNVESLVSNLEEGTAYVENDLPGADFNYGPYESMKKFKEFLHKTRSDAVREASPTLDVRSLTEEEAERGRRAGAAAVGSAVREFLELNGFDSIAYRNNYEDLGSESYIVFNPDNIFVEKVRRYKVQGGDLLERGEIIEYGAQPQFAAPRKKRVKTTVREATGQVKDKITIDELKAQRIRYEAEKRAATKAAAKAAADVKRTERQLAQERLEDFKLKQKAREGEIEERKDALKIVIGELPSAVRKELPPTIQRLDIKSELDLDKAIEKIDEALVKFETKQSQNKLKKVIKNLNPKRFRPEFWKKIQEIVGDLDMSKPTAKTVEGMLKLKNFLTKISDPKSKHYDPDLAAELEMYNLVHGLDRLTKKPIANMTKEEADAAIAAIQLLEQLNRLKQQLITHNRRVNRAQRIATVLREMKAAQGRYTARRKETGERKGELKPESRSMVRAFTSFFGLSRARILQPDAMADLLSGGANTTMWDTLYGDIDRAYSDFLSDYYDSVDYITGVLKDLGVDTSTKKGMRMMVEMSRPLASIKGRFFARKADGSIGKPELVKAKFITFKAPTSGTEIELTEGELIDVLAHFYDADTVKQMLGGAPVKIVGLNKEVQLTAKDIIELKRWAEENHQRAVQIADAMVSYANGPLAQLMERWSVDKHGYSNVSENTWWSRPREHSKQEQEALEKQGMVRRSLSSAGVTKARVEKSKDPILIQDAFVKFSNLAWTISGVSNMENAISTAKAVLNDKKVKEFISETKHSSDIKSYYNDLFGELVESIVGGVPIVGSVDRWGRRLRNNFVKGTLALNPRVGAYQFVSVAAATAEIPHLYVAEATSAMGLNVVGSMAHTVRGSNESEINRIDNAMDTWSPYLRLRFDSSAFGLVTSRSGMDAVALFGVPPKGEKGMMIIQGMDRYAIRTLWRSSELWVSADIKNGKLDMVEGSDAYWSEVARRTETAVKRTQPTMDPLHSSGLTKEAKRSWWASLLTMFMSQRNKNANMIARALLKSRRRELSPRSVKPLISTLMYQPLGLIFIAAVYESVLTGDDEAWDNLNIFKGLPQSALSINLGNVPVGDYLAFSVKKIGEAFGLLDEKYSGFDPSLPVLSTLDSLHMNTVALLKNIVPVFTEDEVEKDKLIKAATNTALNYGRLRGYQLTPVFSQLKRMYLGRFGADDYVKEFNKMRRELKGIELQDRTKEDNRNLATLNSYFESMSGIRSDLRKLKDAKTDKAKETIERLLKRQNDIAKKAIEKIRGK